MKKLLRVAIVLGLVFCLSLTAFAAGSKTNVLEAKAVDANGNAIDLVVDAGDGSVSLSAEEAVAAIAVDGLKADELTIYLGDARYVGDGDPVYPIDITFSGYTAGDNDKVYVLHYNGTAWEKVGEGTGKTVVGHFTSLSPVAIVVQSVANAGNGEPTAPKTGEPMTALYAGMVIVLAGAVALVAYKKKETV